MIIKYFSKDLHASANQLQSYVSAIPVLYFTMLSVITYLSLSFHMVTGSLPVSSTPKVTQLCILS